MHCIHDIVYGQTHNVMQAHSHTYIHSHAHAYTSHRTWVQLNYYKIIIIMQLRSRRQTGTGTPTPHGDYLFAGDGNQYARVYYSGSPSPVSLPPAFQLLWLLYTFKGYHNNRPPKCPWYFLNLPVMGTILV